MLLELAELLGHGAALAEAVRESVVAWFDLRCGRSEGAGQSTLSKT